MNRKADVRGERILLAIVAVILLGLNLAVTFPRVEPPWPLTPWEPALLTEGWRFANGVSRYETPPRIAADLQAADWLIRVRDT
jgi:hypothetical protein